MITLDDQFILCHARRAANYPGEELVFNQIHSNQEWEQLGKFRIKYYTKKKPYMLTELNDSGLDEYDTNSQVYAAWFRHELIATIRLRSYPFESNSFIEEEILHQFLGQHYRTEYLEWTRLLIQPQHSIKYLLPGLISYAGMKILATHPFHKYFGYSTYTVKRLFFRFLVAKEGITFKIPHRGEQLYTLLKGDFVNDFEQLIGSFK